MNKQEKKLLEEIEKDCLKLKRAKQLTEYGKGQLDLIRIIRKENLSYQKRPN